MANELALGNLDAERDWGYAKDYVEAMWLMLQQPEPADYVVATGVSHSVRELVHAAFGHLGLDPTRYVRHDERFVRPAELVNLVGDPSKAHDRLGWQAQTPFEELIQLMVDADLELLASSDAAASQLA
jgi:GDPmannose 4,6-dehydratase